MDYITKYIVPDKIDSIIKQKIIQFDETAKSVMDKVAMFSDKLQKQYLLFSSVWSNGNYILINNYMYLFKSSKNDC